MSLTKYPGVIHKEDDSAFGIHFPDFPGCISAGDTIEEALEMGAEALQLHVEGMVEDGDDIPTPSPMKKEMADDDGILVFVSVTIPGKMKRYNVMLDEKLVSDIDAIAPNRSAFLNEAARAELERRTN
ncbi:HicB family protein [Sneathiella sp. P13V-1]|uniref:type II toxin-antitoxin system HicB family antitoxin n=1 Tax=Sneathiella sp. P13V-1 TaxID=2697366 RepID=UPI00187B3AED|nr:type II toxin-antitoxin system HicB family antitoxin [Sneathiella sp. P13V-1]MBE7637615.1 HicB family protein [Sneathiella sp. P13V-1]